MTDLVVAVIAFNDMSPFHLSIPCVVFAEDKRPSTAQSWFQVRVCSVEGEKLSTNTGFSIHCDTGYEGIDSADIVIVPGWPDVNRVAPEKLINALQAAYQKGSKIVGLCLGAYVLAQSGLLKYKRATTHWAWIEDFQQRFPDVTLDAQPLYIEQDQILTSAGAAAGIDCCLHIVRQCYGHQLANRVAKRLVTSTHRQGKQTQFVDQPIAKTIPDLRMSQLLDSIRGDLMQPYSIDEVAQRLCVSRRTFTRKFKKMTGLSFNAWVLCEKLRLAQSFLETTTHSIEAIAVQCGFKSSVALRKQFKLTFDISPSAYRQNFQRDLSSPPYTAATL